MKDVIVIANFCGEMSDANNDRFVYLCKELSKNNKVELITNDFSHNKKAHRTQTGDKMPFKVTALHEPGYKKNVSLQRFLSHRFWGKEVEKYLKHREKPDVIYCAVPSLTAPLVASRYCAKNHIPFIVDIQDLWPEAFKMVFNLPVGDLFWYPFLRRANRIYANADEIVAVSDYYVQRALAVNKKGAKGHSVYIGTRLEKYDECAKGEPLCVKPEGEVWIGYCGTLAVSYDIPNLILAVKSLEEKGLTGIKLIIMGDGGYKEKFQAIAEQKGINVLFTGKLPYDQMCAQLNQCDIVVNPIKHGSAASIINKHGDYAASGRPVVNSQENEEYRKLIEDYNMGFNCKNEDADDMAQKLELLVVNKSLREEMGKNARKCAEVKFDRKHSYQTIINLISK